MSTILSSLGNLIMLLVILWKFVSFETTGGVNDMVLFLVCLQILSNGKYKSAQHWGHN